MKKWLIFGNAGWCSPYIIVMAESFDEALKSARKIDSRYVGGCMIRE